MEAEWIPALQQRLDIARDALPAIWDADFLHGARSERGEDTYVLCEINGSSVFPFPEKLARSALVSLQRHRHSKHRRD
jgi:hypothetical protein